MQKRQAEPSRRGPRLETVLEQAQELQNAGDIEGALEILKAAPPYLQRRAELQLARGTLYLALDDLQMGREALEEAERLDPNHPFVNFFLAGIYNDEGWLNRTLQCAQKVLEYRDVLPQDVVQSTEEIVQENQERLQELAARLDAPPTTVRKAISHSERGERLASQGQLELAGAAFHQANQVLPEWLAPLNKEALYYFLDGQIEQAIRISEQLLKKDPRNIQANAHLARFYGATGEEEKLGYYVERLKESRLEHPLEVEQAVEALGILGNDPVIYDIYRQNRSILDQVGPTTLFAMGSAAANLGHSGTARQLWQQAKKSGAPAEIVSEMKEALQSNAPGPSISQRYPTCHIFHLLPAIRLKELYHLMESWEESGDDEQLRQEMQAFAARNPHLAQALAKLIWEEPESMAMLGIQALGAFNTPATIAELERFAFSQFGPMRLRGSAAQALAEAGALDISQPIALWDETREEWHMVNLLRWKIVSGERDLPDSEEFRKLLTASSKALEQEQWEIAKNILEVAIALEPQAGIAYHNLAVALQRMGDWEAAKEVLEKAVEINPTYVFALCTLARYYIFEKPDLEQVEQILQPIFELNTLYVDEMIYFQMTLAHLAIEREDYPSVRQHLEIVLEIDPENRAALSLEQELVRIETYQSPYWQKYRQQQRQREEKKRRRPTHPSAGLVECLERLTKEALIATARAMPLSVQYNVRKAVLIERLAEILADPDWLEDIVGDLTTEERQALRDVLDAGGTMPWETFAERYDHDLDDSPYWQWHEPETIMGWLRMMGLLSEGTVSDQLIVLVPSELRGVLPAMLEKASSSKEE
ncbi:MAG: tetratricopeptide repeat protein [Anaerolineae bacterium]|nr:tetratricopeptide repeat protein [Anaerolineae bacterium]